MKGQLRFCQKLGEERAIASIEKSVSSSWQGLFEPKDNLSKNNTGNPTTNPSGSHMTTPKTTPTVPHDIIAERASLCLLSAGGQVAANAAPWSQDLFFDRAHRQLFEVIANQLEESKPVDYLALCQLENVGKIPLMGNSGVLTEILLTLPPETWKDRSGPSLAKYYFDILNDCLQRRGYMEASIEDLPAVTRAR